MKFDPTIFSGARVLVIGDLMVDEYLFGEVERISPEAPVPIVSITSQEYRLGGAGNVIGNILALGGVPMVAGIIGDDQWGRLLTERLSSAGADTGGIVTANDRPTTRKTRIIAANQQMLRIDHERVAPVADRLLPPLYRYIESAVPHADVVLVSDYAKGLIDDSMMEEIIITAKKHNKSIVADPKGIDFTKYSGVDLITPNRKEAGLAAGVDAKDPDFVLKTCKRLMDVVSPQALLITCGKDGMILKEKEANPVHIKARAKQVFDVSGAGDTVLALMGLGLASGLSFVSSARIANIAAGIVVGKVGTATVTPEELKSALSLEDLL